MEYIARRCLCFYGFTPEPANHRVDFFIPQNKKVFFFWFCNIVRKPINIFCWNFFGGGSDEHSWETFKKLSEARKNQESCVV